MQVESLEVLEKADVPPAQARAIVRAIELELAGTKDTLATKHDVLALRHAMLELATTLRSEMTALGLTLRAEMATQLGNLRAEIQTTASSVLRQLYVAIFGQTAVMLGFTYFLVTHLR